METHFSNIDWIVLVVYFTATMGIGFYLNRKSRSPEGSTAGGRSLPGWACGLSIFATYLSSISFLALPGKAYAANWNPFVFSLSLPIATWAAVQSPFHAFFIPVLGTLTILLAGLLISGFTGSPQGSASSDRAGQ